MKRTQSPSQYERAQKAKARAQVRAVLDAHTPAPSVNRSPAAHPQHIVMVAEDARMEDEWREGADPTRPLVILAQIPPFRVGRATYRVIGERVVEEKGKDTRGEPVTRRRGEIALVCRTRASTLYQHGVHCACAVCLHVSTVDLWHSIDVWYHNTTETWHLRMRDGTFNQIHSSVIEIARQLQGKRNHYTFTDGLGRML